MNMHSNSTHVDEFVNERNVIMLLSSVSIGTQNYVDVCPFGLTINYSLWCRHVLLCGLLTSWLVAVLGYDAGRVRAYIVLFCELK